eukprot:TRINITY_DN11457_c0_g1_i1.p1 TRINITY_DN11457_c0_g1~~TRINITY_DN11457_c0_g1_i1.p1  ORF type:complete len:490 (+),score=100.79 TRINITY_DN11457_c0_g1_i1:137-1471(+)
MDISTENKLAHCIYLSLDGEIGSSPDSEKGNSDSSNENDSDFERKKAMGSVRSQLALARMQYGQKFFAGFLIEELSRQEDEDSDDGHAPAPFGARCCVTFLIRLLCPAGETLPSWLAPTLATDQANNFSKMAKMFDGLKRKGSLKVDGLQTLGRSGNVGAKKIGSIFRRMKRRDSASRTLYHSGAHHLRVLHSQKKGQGGEDSCHVDSDELSDNATTNVLPEWNRRHSHNGVPFVRLDAEEKESDQLSEIVTPRDQDLENLIRDLEDGSTIELYHFSSDDETTASDVEYQDIEDSFEKRASLLMYQKMAGGAEKMMSGSEQDSDPQQQSNDTHESNAVVGGEITEQVESYVPAMHNGTNLKKGKKKAKKSVPSFGSPSPMRKKHRFSVSGSQNRSCNNLEIRRGPHSNKISRRTFDTEKKEKKPKAKSEKKAKAKGEKKTKGKK